MKIRPMINEDINRLREIHDAFYPNLEFPDFTRFAYTFVIEDAGNIITGGGVRALAEVSILTDKSFPVCERRDALNQALQSSLLAAGRFGFSQLHCFVADDKWAKHLKKVGFRETTDKLLILG